MRILITTFGSLGDIHPYLAIASHLTDSGVHVTFATNEQHCELIRSRGFVCHSLRPRIEPSPSFYFQVMNGPKAGRFLLRDLLMPAIRDTYRDILAVLPGHDLLVSHPATFAAPLAARATGIPWVSTVLAPLSLFSSIDPPVLLHSLIAVRRVSPSCVRIVNGAAHWHSRRWTRPVRKLQRDLGQPSAGHPAFEGQHSSRAVIALFSSHFAPPAPDWPTQTILTGFPLLPPEPLTEEVERFLTAGPPPIVFTLGSAAVNAAGAFFEVARCLGRRAILLAGSSAAEIPVTANVLAVDYVPHSAIFPHAAAIVHQGGIGTTSEALRSGRPSLVVPFAHDQPDNAARCERLGVARILSRAALSRKRLSRELDTLLTAPSYAQASRALAAQLSTEEGAANAARSLLENALS